MYRKEGIKVPSPNRGGRRKLFIAKANAAV
jgi:hypothetical protein